MVTEQGPKTKGSNEEKIILKDGNVMLLYQTLLTTCISPFSPGLGGHGFGRELFSVEPGEQ